MGVLDVYGLAAGVLRGVGFGLGAGERAVLTGPSGSGKTTLLRAVSGLVAPERGRVMLEGTDITGWPPERIAAAGLVHVLERRKIFARMSVADNLALGGWTRSRSARAADLDRVLGLFPRLRPWLNRPGDALPASERGLLSIARGLMAAPAVLLVDEPAAGLDPEATDELTAALTRLRAENGPVLLLAERRPGLSGPADRVYVLADGALTEARSGEL